MYTGILWECTQTVQFLLAKFGICCSILFSVGGGSVLLYHVVSTYSRVALQLLLLWMFWTSTGIEYIKVPTWLFHGGDDTVIPINTSLQIMHRYIIMSSFSAQFSLTTHWHAHAFSSCTLTLISLHPLLPIQTIFWKSQNYYYFGWWWFISHATVGIDFPESGFWRSSVF